MRRGSKHRSGDSGNLWICFSDLMSALMLIFVLILFYAVYQYYDMLEVKTAELMRQSGLLDEQSQKLSLSEEALKEKEAALILAQQSLDEKENELTGAQAALVVKEDELNAQSLKLSETEQALLNEKAKLLLQEDTLNALQIKLDEQESELSAAQARLNEQESELSAAQISLNEALDAQQAQQVLLDAQQAQLDKLVGVKGAIIEELVRALADSNISGASVDDSGAIVFSSEMMFDVNRATLKDVGKAFLDSFIPGYFRVLMSEEYSQYVSQIIIEGHTDTDGTFMKNMELSQDRAYAVLNYILSDEFTDISLAAKQKLQKIVTVNGRSYSDPVYKADGTIDKAASRRVVIKFRMNDEDMVNEMLHILEKTN